MKHMNNKYRIPFNLQFFAEGAGDSEGSETVAEGSDGQGAETGEEDNGPTMEDVLAQLAEAKAEQARLKLASDRASKEAAGYKKQLQARMSAQEQEDAAKAEAEQAKDARIQELESKFRTMEYSKRYMGMGMDEKSAEAIAELTGELSDVDKFFLTLGKFVQAVQKKSADDAVQKAIKDYPEIMAGTGDKGTSLSVEKAKSLAASSHFGTVNQEALKQFM